MRLEQLELENFRNIGALSLSPAPGINVICGDNAQGKTNLVEAIWLFTGAKSFRGAKDRELIRFGSTHCTAKVRFFCDGREQEGLIRLGEEGKGGVAKKILLNDIPLESASRLSGRFYAVVFSPVHLSLVKDGPELRRKFLDTALSQLIPKYSGYLREYKRILQQRNALMKDLYRFPQLADTADVWDEHLARVGAAILYCRGRYVERITPAAQKVYCGISSGRERLELFYRGPVEDCESASMERLRELLAARLRESRREDMEHGSTSVGPHRDDLEVEIDGMPARLYGSQGQQRSCVLALKMAECAMIEETVGESPIVLLDDVMSELDARRRDYLLNQIEGRQVFVTCCDDQSFRELREGGRFCLSRGELWESGQPGKSAGEEERENVPAPGTGCGGPGEGCGGNL